MTTTTTTKTMTTTTTTTTTRTTTTTTTTTTATTTMMTTTTTRTTTTTTTATTTTMTTMMTMMTRDHRRWGNRQRRWGNRHREVSLVMSTSRASTSGGTQRVIRRSAASPAHVSAAMDSGRGAEASPADGITQGARSAQDAFPNPPRQ